jgi:ribosomal protein S18 acetylase RimI-like enzyme
MKVCDPKRKKIIYRAVAELHLSEINGGFLSSLGLNFLTLMYEAIDKSPNSTLIIIYSDKKIIGFVTGGFGLKKILLNLIKKMPSLILALLPVIANPKALKNIIDILISSLLKNKKSPNSNAELFSIVVTSDEKKKGYGQSLFNELKEWFVKKGASSFIIMVGKDLKYAQKFYENMGAIPEGKIELHKNDISIIYRQNI